MSPAAEKVIQRLDRARQRWWLFSLLEHHGVGRLRVVRGVSRAHGGRRVDPATAGLAAGAVYGVAGGDRVLIVARCRRLAGGHREMEAAARRVEMDLPELGSDLINVVQLSEAGGARRDANVAGGHACRCAPRGHGFSPGRGRRGGRPPSRRAVRAGRGKAVALAALALCMQTPCDLAESLLVLALLIAAAMLGDRWMPNWRLAASRLLAPWEFVPSVGSVEITEVTPGNVEVLPGESVDIAGLGRATGERPTRRSWCSWAKTAGSPAQAMAADGWHQHYRATVSCVLRPLRYRWRSAIRRRRSIPSASAKGRRSRASRSLIAIRHTSAGGPRRSNSENWTSSA